jgi:3-dehydrosphinganine reductase
MDWYRGKRVIVTGGSSGIGRATAEALAEWGSHVAIVARECERLERASGEIRARRASIEQRVEPLQADVARREDVERAISLGVERLGGVDILVNNAGVAHCARFEETSDAQFERMMEVNYRGVVNVTRTVLPHLKAQGRGHIANVSSVAGFLGIYGYTAYAASKFAVVGFSEALRQELLPYGIAVSVLFPPDTDTPQLTEENRTKPPETRAIVGRVRVMAPEAVARALLEGIASGRHRIVPGIEARLTHSVARHFPGVMRRLIDRALPRP